MSKVCLVVPYIHSGYVVEERLLQHPLDFFSFPFLDFDWIEQISLLIVIVLLPFSCVQLRKVCCRSSRIQTGVVEPSVVNQLLPECSQRFIHECWRMHCSCDRLIPANQPYSTIFLSVPAMLPASSCSSPISFFHAQIPAHHHHQWTPNASDTSDPSIIQQFSHLWHTPARRVHWVLVQEMSTHDQLSLVRFDARSRVLSLLVLHFVNLGLRSFLTGIG